MPYLPNTEDVRKEMLSELGKKDFSELVSSIPEDLRLKKLLKIPRGVSEYKLRKEINNMLSISGSTDELTCFAGGGVYDHFVPAVVPFIAGRSEFYTAYTPYQAEVSQGTLQAYFEFQSLVCDLTQMDAANASMYDGGTATAEAVLMAERIKKGKKILVASTFHPHTKEIIKTYLGGLDLNVQWIPEIDGHIDMDFVMDFDGKEVSAVVVQSPNYYGQLEDVAKIRDAFPQPTLLILNSDMISLGILKKPGRLGVDIFTGDGQGLGNGLYYGGPTCGVFACSKKYVRQMPGRIAGMTKDKDGKIGFVTTLQTREQHIRRSKATSNICTAQALNALATAVFMAVTGKNGIYEMANQSIQKALYLAESIDKLEGFNVKYKKGFVKEFLVETPAPGRTIIDRGIAEGFLPGITLEGRSDENLLLMAVTEKRAKEEMDALVDFLKQFRK